MARLPAATALLLLLPSLCCTDATDPTSVSMPAQAPTISTTKTPVSMPNAATGVTEPTTETSSKGMTNTNTPGLLALTSSTTSGSAGSTAHGVTKEESVTTEVTLATSSSAIPTSRSSRNATENQSSIKTTEISVNTQQPDQSPSEATVLPSTSTTSENVSQFQGMEDGKNTSSLSTSPSYSSIILPVVIVLIVITLSVFVLVGLYRMCQKKDPGTPENGSDQPQSDKESVKLLTVKTISHESGERCVPEKTKN